MAYFPQPWQTKDLEPFVYVAGVTSTTSVKATAKVYPRSFDPDELPGMHQTVVRLAEKVASRYKVGCEIGGEGLMYVGTGTAIQKSPEILPPIMRTVDEVLGKSTQQSVRGGTDGAMINVDRPDLASPNLGTGMYDFHGTGEFLVVEEMISMYEVMKRLIPAYAA